MTAKTRAVYDCQRLPSIYADGEIGGVGEREEREERSQRRNRPESLTPIDSGPGYHRMPLADKQAYARRSMRAPLPTRCPSCGTGVLPSQLAAHVALQCPGVAIVRQNASHAHHEDASEDASPGGAKVLGTPATHAGKRSRGIGLDDQKPERPTMTNRPSLRALARRLRCSHSSLSAQIHAGLFTTGVAIGAHGRVIVTDIDCAIRAWRGLPTARANEAIVLTDHALDCQVTARQLFEERDALSLLVTALVSAALGDAVSGPLDDRQVAVLRTRIAAQLRAVAELHGADADDISRAEADLASTLVLLAEEGEDEDEDTPIANRKVGIDISGDS